MIVISGGFLMNGAHVVKYVEVELKNVWLYVLKRVMVLNIVCQTKHVVVYDLKYKNIVMFMNVQDGSCLNGQA